MFHLFFIKVFVFFVLFLIKSLEVHANFLTLSSMRKLFLIENKDYKSSTSVFFIITIGGHYFLPLLDRNGEKADRK